MAFPAAGKTRPRSVYAHLGSPQIYGYGIRHKRVMRWPLPSGRTASKQIIQLISFQLYYFITVVSKRSGKPTSAVIRYPGGGINVGSILLDKWNFSRFKVCSNHKSQKKQSCLLKTVQTNVPIS